MLINELGLQIYLFKKIFLMACFAISLICLLSFEIIILTVNGCTNRT